MSPNASVALHVNCLAILEFGPSRSLFACSVLLSMLPTLVVKQHVAQSPPRFAFVDLVKKRLTSADKPDYIVGIFYANGEANLLNVIEAAKSIPGMCG